MRRRRRPEIYDVLRVTDDVLVIHEMFKASDVRWIRTVNRRGENRYFTEREWFFMVYRGKK